MSDGSRTSRDRRSTNIQETIGNMLIAGQITPVAFVIAMTTGELRPWRRTLKYIRALPESTRPEHRSTSRR